MILNKKKNENKVGTHRPCICKTKMFSTIQYLFDWTHEPCAPTQYDFTFVTW